MVSVLSRAAPWTSTSFVHRVSRCLAQYDFHKTVQDPSHGEFRHQYFQKDHPELLIYIKRKANNRTAETLKKLSKTSSQASAGAQDKAHAANDVEDDESIVEILPDELLNETGTVLSELEQQRLMHFELERKMEAKMEKLEQENEYLKRLFFESNQKTMFMQERVEKVLKTLYTVFSSNPQLGKSLLTRMPSLSIENGSFSSPKAMITDGSMAGVSAFGGDSASLGPGADLSLRRLPSYDPYAMLGGYAGAELSAANRGTSFDFAAASVTAPQKYLSSFDRAVFGKASDIGVESDRVTVLSDDAPSSSSDAAHSRGLKRSNSKSSLSPNDDREWKLPRMEAASSSEPIVTSPGSGSPQGTAREALLGPPLAPEELEPQTRQFIDLLNRNQNTTLCRLDSLEQTLATLLDDIEDDGFVGGDPKN
jgi:hypothetical protein